jgi:sensor c-di-GMP phosphodiesterase-like protein
MEAGWILEIDDFGKGYSSLGELKDLNFNTLKIDKSFIDETENQERSRAILESVFEMTKKLRMEVITEGVERKEQVDRLSAMGCKTFQGYYFDRPLPVPDFISKYLSGSEA